MSASKRCMNATEKAATTLGVILALSSIPIAASPALCQERYHFTFQFSNPWQPAPQHLVAQAVPQEKGKLKGIPTPQSGVRLLEEVFQKVRSAPQVAMAKVMQQQAEAQSNLKLAADNKMVRPPSAGKPAILRQPGVDLSNSQQWQIASNPNNMIYGNEGTRVQTGGAAGGMLPPPPMGSPVAGNMNAPMSSTTAPAPAAAAAPASPAFEMYQGNRQFIGNNPERKGVWEPGGAQSVEKSKASNALADQFNDDSSAVTRDYRDRVAEMQSALQRQAAQAGGGGGTGYVDAASRNRSVAGRGAVMQLPMARAQRVPSDVIANQPPDLGTAFTKFGMLNKQLQEMQNNPQAAYDKLRSSDEERELRADHAAFKDAQSRFEFAPNKWKNESASTVRSNSMAKKAKADANKETELDQDHAYPAANSYNARRMQQKQVKLAMGETGIAALPPNVVTGIPRIRLGIPEAQALSALAASGKTRREVVDKWTVLSWQRDPAKAQIALQLYVHNGQLDGMRIFDPSLLAPDFGVNLGADLGRVKERFGDPAFMIAEPSPGDGQNYIYPISQVGFQLSKTPGGMPHVVSVLIFNVK